MDFKVEVKQWDLKLFPLSLDMRHIYCENVFCILDWPRSVNTPCAEIRLAADPRPQHTCGTADTNMTFMTYDFQHEFEFRVLNFGDLPDNQNWDL